VVTAVKSSVGANANSATPTTRHVTAGSADAMPGGRTLIVSMAPGPRPNAVASPRVASTGQGSASAAGEARLAPCSTRQTRSSVPLLPTSEMPRGGLVAMRAVAGSMRMLSTFRTPGMRPMSAASAVEPEIGCRADSPSLLTTRMSKPDLSRRSANDSSSPRDSSSMSNSSAPMTATPVIASSVRAR
jgi:hypothetical protein